MDPRTPTYQSTEKLLPTHTVSTVTNDTLTPAPSVFVQRFKITAFLKSLLRHDSKPEWRPSVFKIRPLLGLVAVAMSFVCMFVSLAILMVSHNQPISSWPIQPTVYLAIAAATANCTLGVARYNATPIAWWYSISRGTTINQLERQWESGHSLALALRHNVHMGWVGFATLLITLQIIDGPLLQRATSIGSATQTKSVTLALKISQEVPTGFSGYDINDGVSQSSLSTRVISDWRDKAPIMLDVQQCNGTCTATIRAPGVSKANCTSQSWTINSTEYYDPNATWGAWHSYDSSRDVFFNPLFLINLQTYSPTISLKSEAAVLETGILSFTPMADGNVSGEYVDTVCYYVPAVLEYDLVIQGKEATISNSPKQYRTVSIANNTRNANLVDTDVTAPNTMDVFTMYLNLVVGTNTSVVIDRNETGVPWSMDSSTIQAGNAQFAKYVDMTADPALVIADPTPDIISSLNEMLFRAGVMSTDWANLTSLTDNGLPVEQTLQANQTTTQNVYCSDLRWFAGAAALEILAALFVLPLFWGWWTLDSTRELSPLSIALAFDAPLLKGANSATGASKVVKHMGDVCVRYGVVESGSRTHDVETRVEVEEDGAYRLGIAEIGSVRQPQKGMRFQV